MITLQERVHGVKPPEEWSLNKLHHVFSVRKNNKNIGMMNDNLLSLSYGKIVNKDIDTNGGLLPESFETYQIVNPGDIVMRLTDLQNDKRSIRQGLVKEKGIITSAYDAIYVGQNHDSRYWAYALLALDLAKYYYSLGGGVRQSIKFKDFPNDWISFPSQDKQKEIADFLDQETTQIDNLIQKKKKLFNLLEEKRKAKTKFYVFGQHLSVSFVENSISWMPSLPEEWLIQKLGHHFYNLDSKRIPLNSEQRGDHEKIFPYYGASGIIDYVNDYIFDEDLILVGEDGANLVIQTTPIAFIAHGKYWVNNHAHIIKPKNGFLDYWVHALNQIPYEIYVTGSAQPKLTSEALRNLKLPVPPINLQIQIAKEINTEHVRIDLIKKPLEESTIALREYRNSLITETVTGHLNIQDWKKRGMVSRQLDNIENDFS